MSILPVKNTYTHNRFLAPHRLITDRIDLELISRINTLFDKYIFLDRIYCPLHCRRERIIRGRRPGAPGIGRRLLGENGLGRNLQRVREIRGTVARILCLGEGTK